MNFLENIPKIIYVNLADLWEVDWSAVQFKEEYFVVRAALILLAALFFKILWRWRRPRKTSHYEHSGYAVGRRQEPGWVYGTLRTIPILLIAGGAFFALVAMADPYTLQHGQTKFEELREIGYLRDTSISMGWRYKGSERARAEIVQDFVLKLIASRQDKKDRSCYITFSALPRLIADFTTDHQSLLFSVATGPLVTADPTAPEQAPGRFIVKDFDRIPFEGGTDLYLGLQAAIKIFDEKGDKKITAEIKSGSSLKKRSVIIITDGASENDPEPALKELQKRSIVPYLVFIDPDRGLEAKMHGENAFQIQAADKLLKQVRKYGGESFLAVEQTALEKIVKKLDLLHASTVGVKTFTAERHIYRWPLVLALLCLAGGLITRLIFGKFHHTV